MKYSPIIVLLLLGGSMLMTAQMPRRGAPPGNAMLPYEDNSLWSFTGHYVSSRDSEIVRALIDAADSGGDSAGIVSKRAVALARKTISGGDHPDLAKALRLAARICYGKEEYREAETMFVEALAMRRRMATDKNPDLAASITDMALFYVARGRNGMAEPLFAEALELEQRLDSRGRGEPVVLAIANMASVAASRGNYNEAELLYTKAVTMFSQILGGARTPQLAKCLYDFAELYQSRGCYDEAEPLLNNAYWILKGDFAGYPDSRMATCLSRLATLRFHQGRFQAAKELLAEALTIRRDLGSDVSLATVILNIGMVCRELGEIDSAIIYFNELPRILSNELASSGGFESEFEQMAIKRRLDRICAAVIGFCILNIDGYKGVEPLAADLIIATKSEVLNTITRQRRMILQHTKDDSAMSTLWDGWRRVRVQVADLYAAGPFGAMAYRSWKSSIDSLQQIVNGFEKELAHRGFELITSRPVLTWRNVAMALTDDEAMVEIARISLDSQDGDSNYVFYCALIIRHKYVRPILIPLCEENTLKELIDYSVTGAYQDDKSYVHDAARQNALYRLIWGPIAAILGRVRRVYVSPDGLFNRIALGILSDSTGRRLMDCYELHYLFGSQDLACDLDHDDVGNVSRPTAAVIGNPHFESDSGLCESISTIRNVRWQDDTILTPSDRTPPKPGSNRNDEIGRPLPNLAGSELECDSIIKILERNAYNTSSYIDVRATEEAFVVLESPTVLHVATHGFFFSGPQRNPEDRQRAQALIGAGLMRSAENPYLRSGILLAGADRVWTLHRPLEGIGDGIVTAYDVAQMNLVGTDLVVLSACETGLGDIWSSEGVVGLKRAFRAAGARAVMMSLWKVPDVQTRELMVLFYTNWLDNHMSKAEALTAAQREMAKRYDDPYYWGAFLLVGE